MLERVLELLSGIDESDPEGLLLLNLAIQVQDHSGIDWTLETITEVVRHFQLDLDNLEE